jgi:WD40 repeat protein
MAKQALLDPIATLPIPNWAPPPSAGGLSRSSITSICFLSSSINATINDDNQPICKSYVGEGTPCIGSQEDDSSSSSCSYDEKLESNSRLRCHSVKNLGISYQDTIDGSLLSCNVKGEILLWDIGLRKVVRNNYFVDEPVCRGPGLLLRRVYNPNIDDSSSERLLYQTRDAFGTISFHDTTNGQTISRIQTKSQTFCTASPCVGGNPNLLLAPDEDDTIVALHDWRIPSINYRPVLKLRPTTQEPNRSHFHEAPKQNGMVTSLGLSMTSSSLIAACGMESGHLVFYDLAMPNQNVRLSPTQNLDAISMQTVSRCSVHLSSDPILSVDVSSTQRPSSSALTSTPNDDSVVTIAGMAGDRSDLADKRVEDRGTVAIIKTIRQKQHENNNDSSRLVSRVRSKLTTCTIPDTGDVKHDMKYNGKPGVSICRFSPNGQFFAVGGWDHRVRIFRRSARANRSSVGAPAAIFKGHNSSVNSIDWRPCESNDQLVLASAGASDDKMHIWRFTK